MERAEEVMKQMKTGLTPNAAYNADAAKQEAGSTHMEDANTSSALGEEQDAVNKK